DLPEARLHVNSAIAAASEAADPWLGPELRRDEAMLLVDDGDFPAADRLLGALFDDLETASGREGSDQRCLTLQARATVRRYAGRPREALDDLRRADRAAAGGSRVIQRGIAVSGAY